MTNTQLTLTFRGFKIWIQMLRFDSLCLKPLTAVPIFKQRWRTVIFWNSLVSPPCCSPRLRPQLTEMSPCWCSPVATPVHGCSGTSGPQLEVPELHSTLVDL